MDLPGIIPFFFARFYFVLLMGRDRHFGTGTVESGRKQFSALAGGSAFMLVVSLPLIALGFLFLYAMKSDMGINLFDRRLADYVGDVIGLLQ